MEETGIIGIKLIMFCAIFLQISDLAQAQNVFDYLDTFGTVAILIFGIRYFIKELKNRDEKHERLDREKEERQAKELAEAKAEYLERWQQQEARHNTLMEAKDATTKELLETQRQIFMNKPE